MLDLSCRCFLFVNLNKMQRNKLPSFSVFSSPRQSESLTTYFGQHYKRGDCSMKAGEEMTLAEVCML